MILEVGRGEAYRTIQSAVNAARRGDRIEVDDDWVYKENVHVGKGVTLVAVGDVVIDASGNKSKPGIDISASNVTVQGFEVKGSGQSGISSSGNNNVRIIGNEVHDNARHGIYFGRGDDAFIFGNDAHNNAHSGPFSGISVHAPKGDGVIEVRGNISHHNVTKTQVVNGKEYHTDGNGYIADDWRSTQHPDEPGYNGRGIFADNLAYENGGAGYLAAWSDYIHFDHNTAFHNNQDATRAGTKYKGELDNRFSSHNDWTWNVAVSEGSAKAISSNSTTKAGTTYTNVDVNWEHNMTWSGRAGDHSVIWSEASEQPDASENRFAVNPKINMATGQSAYWDFGYNPYDLINTENFLL